MAQMGDKVEASAQSAAGVPLCPGTEEATTLDDARGRARAGLPALPKRAGGGRG
jgi:hypothetical protein